jgi:Tol biopolymer transport system component
LYYVNDGSEYRSVFVGQLDAIETKRLLSDADAGAVYAASGHLFYVRQDTLFAQPFDSARLELAGDPVPIAQPVASGPNMVALSASAAGPVAYRAGSGVSRRQLVWLDRSGNLIERIGDSGFFLDPALSHDGGTVAIRQDVDGLPGISLLDTKRGTSRRFTSGGGSFPVWSPDDSSILFSANYRDTGVNDLYLKPVTGAGREELLLSTPQIKAAMDWTSDGRYALYRIAGNDLLAVSLGDRKSFPVAQTAFDERDGQFSPDGRWIAFVSNESGRFEVYVQPFPGPGQKVSISSNGGGQPRWRRDGNELFYIALDGQLMAVPLTLAANGQAIEGGAPVRLFAANVGAAVQSNNKQQYMVSPDGQRFLLNTILEEAASPITVILNWTGTPSQ